jgi:hypothetical protein
MKKTILFILIFCFFLLSINLEAQTWSSLIRLTWNSGGSEYPKTAIDSSNVIHLVWDENPPLNNEEIYYKKSANGGTSFTAPMRLTWTSTMSVNPLIAVDSSKIHVVWNENLIVSENPNFELMYKQSTDGGANWSAPKRLTFSSGGSMAYSLVVDSSSIIHVAYVDNSPGNNEIFHKRSTDGGITWSPPKRLTWNSGSSETPRMAIDSANNIHLIWSNFVSSAADIFYKQSTDNGTNWSAPKRLTWSANSALNPSFAADSGSGLYLAWDAGATSNHEIYFKKSTNGGLAWLSPQRMTWNPGRSWVPCITADGGTGIYIVWIDQPASDFEIFFKCSNDSGTNWDKPVRLTWSIGGSWNPVVATDSGSAVHVFWSDGSPGNYEIFYKNRK